MTLWTPRRPTACLQKCSGLYERLKLVFGTTKRFFNPTPIFGICHWEGHDRKTPSATFPIGTEFTRRSRRRFRRNSDDTKHAMNTGPTPRPPTINGNPSLRFWEKRLKAAAGRCPSSCSTAFAAGSKQTVNGMGDDGKQTVNAMNDKGKTNNNCNEG